MIAATAVAGIVLAVVRHSASHNYRLPGGRVLHLERVELARHDDIHRNFDPSLGWWGEAKLALGRNLRTSWGRKLADSVYGYLTSKGDFEPWHTNTDSLRVWLVERNGLAGSLRGFEIDGGEVVDEHGCVYPATRISADFYGPIAAYTPHGYNSWVLTFEAFPRREKTFKLRAREASSGAWAEYMIANPVVVTNRGQWVAEPLPITRTKQGVEIILSGVDIRTNHSAGPDGSRALLEVAPRLEFREHGQPTTAWQADGFELWDGAGNVCVSGFGYSRQALFLCPQEPAWRLVAQCFGSEEAPAASNEVWVLRGVPVAAPGVLAVVQTNHDFRSALLTWTAMAGPGAVEYAGRTLMGASNAPSAGGSNAVTYAYVPGKGRIVSLISSGCQLVLRVRGGSPDQALTARAVDDKGQSYYAEAWETGRTGVAQANVVKYLDQRLWADMQCVVLRLPPEVKTVDLHFCIHTARTVEFVIRPPGR